MNATGKMLYSNWPTWASVRKVELISPSPHSGCIKWQYSTTFGPEMVTIFQKGA
jgi:hypothetical protein